MTLRIAEESPARLADYATVPIRFQVTQVFDDKAIGHLRRGEPASASRVNLAYEKDYDAYPDNHPTDWPRRFDVAGWTILAAYEDGHRVGGAVVVVGDPRLNLTRGDPGLAVLWDLRVAPEVRHRGIGSALLRAAQDAAVRRGARELRVETQQVNVAACSFYQHHGFSLKQALPDAYAFLPDEIQLIWRKTIGP